jgi:hypothetical protein
MASAAELETQFTICAAVGYLEQQIVDYIIGQICVVKIMLIKLINKLA